MGQFDIAKQGRPKSSLKRDWQILLYCGGGGAGDCPFVQTLTRFSFVIQVNPFSVLNKNLVLLNPEFFGVRFWADAGPSGPCSSSKGAEQPWYLATSPTDTITDAEILAQNNQFSGATPYQIELSANKLPQPTDPDWDNEIYVHVYWGNAGFVSDIVFTDWTQWLKVVKFDLEIRQ